MFTNCLCYIFIFPPYSLNKLPACCSEFACQYSILDYSICKDNSRRILSSNLFFLRSETCHEMTPKHLRSVVFHNGKNKCHKLKPVWIKQPRASLASSLDNGLLATKNLLSKLSPNMVSDQLLGEAQGNSLP